METTFITWNSCWNLEPIAHATLAEAKARTTPIGNPNRITSSDGKQEWVSCAYADRAPQWFGLYDPTAPGLRPDPQADARRAAAFRQIEAGAKTTRRYFIHFTGSEEVPESPRERDLPDYFDTADECRKAIRDAGWERIATVEAADF